jgi:hypothetical protein
MLTFEEQHARWEAERIYELGEEPRKDGSEEIYAECDECGKAICFGGYYYEFYDHIYCGTCTKKAFRKAERD